MKTTLSIIMGCLLCAAVYAQDFTYSYDVAGNRIKREITQSQQQQILDNPEESLQTTAQEKNEPAFAVLLYPNPTSGILTLELPELQAGEQGSINVYSNMGQIVLQQRSVTAAQTLNLYNLLPGYYIVHITVGNKTVIKQIIKQ